MAVKINELKEKVVQAKAQVLTSKAYLGSLEDRQLKARTDWLALIKQQSEGTLVAETDKGDKAKVDAAGARVSAAEQAFRDFDSQISAARKLVLEAEKDVASAEKAASDEEQRLAAEDAALATKPSGRIEVKDPNRTKDPKRGFADHKDFLGAVMKAGITGGRVFDERLKPMAAQGSDEQGTYSDPHGNFLVPVGVAPGILSVAPEDDPLSPLLTQVPMMSPTVAYNARVDKNHATSVSGGLRVTRRPETVDGTSSRMQFEEVTLTANEEFGLAIASERIITDSPQSFVAIIQAGFRDEYVSFAMNERINGTGVGERLGFLKSAALISVAAEGGQIAGDGILKENVDNMEARCWKYSRAVWLANMTVRPSLKSLVQVVGTGGNAVPYFLASSNGGPETLDGRPIFFTEHCPAKGTIGDLLLVVPSEYLEGTYQSEQYAESIHVRFQSAERMFRFYRRNDGRPWWTSALVPKTGDSLSPIVGLATR